MSKIAQIKKEILRARKSGDTNLEAKLFADLSRLRERTDFTSDSTEAAYGLMADSP